MSLLGFRICHRIAHCKLSKTSEEGWSGQLKYPAKQNILCFQLCFIFFCSFFGGLKKILNDPTPDSFPVVSLGKTWETRAGIDEERDTRDRGKRFSR